MEDYGSVLKNLVKFTNIKLSSLANITGYDVSYVSKWCNQSKLPSTRISLAVNAKLSKTFADEILDQNEFENFCNEFELETSTENLQDCINSMLKNAYKLTLEDKNKKTSDKLKLQTDVFIGQNEISNFVNTAFYDLVFSNSEPVEILCTMDISKLNFILSQNQKEICLKPNATITANVGLNLDTLGEKELLQVYYIINRFHHISFNFFNNSNFKENNLIVIKNKAAIMASINSNGHFEMISVITDPEKVERVFANTSTLFKINHLLILPMSSREMIMDGYRSNFYALNNYQIFLAKGFEYLLPPNLIDSLVKAAYEQGYNSVTEKILRKLVSTWEDLFNHETLDFFMMKTDLIKYIEDGEFYCTDVVYRMSVEERKAHIQRVIEICELNPKINFYIIDDENLSYPNKYAFFSLYSNHNKLFLKNTKSFYDSKGPQFYGILNESLIEKIGLCIDEAKKSEYCIHFTASKVKDFMEKYKVMIERIMSLSEINNLF